VKSEFFIVVLFNLLPPVENQAAVFALVESACSRCMDGLASRRPTVMKFFVHWEKSGRQAMHSWNLNITCRHSKVEVIDFETGCLISGPQRELTWVARTAPYHVKREPDLRPALLVTRFIRLHPDVQKSGVANG
jgi:hypothetical protein